MFVNNFLNCLDDRNLLSYPAECLIIFYKQYLLIIKWCFFYSFLYFVNDNEHNKIFDIIAGYEFTHIEGGWMCDKIKLSRTVLAWLLKSFKQM